jgi:peptidoglycan/xylan/chitin deacetylase (PgdA/CDA1 family)
MTMRIFRPCFIAGWLYPGAIFRLRTDEKDICLTFDDGPDPGSTPFLLDSLKKYDIKAIFFFCGNKAERYPGIVARTKSEGHIIGNHSYSHLNGWNSSGMSYFRDVEMAAPYTSYDWFRPPYGRIKLRQYIRLRKTFKVVFWDLMPYDFDSSFNQEDSLSILKEKIRPGAVIALHDSVTSFAHFFLAEFIEFANSSGYRFVLPS